MMKKALTIVLTGGLVTLFSLNDPVSPKNVSELGLSEEEKMAFSEKMEMFDNMRDVVEEGLFKIELYDENGTLVETADEMNDFNSELKALFAAKNLTIKTVTKVESLMLP